MNTTDKNKKYLDYYNKPEVDLKDLYAMRFGVVWTALRNQHISFWLLCVYFFFEYVRPQTLYPVIDVLPWTQVSLLLTILTVFFDKKVKWVKSPQNKYFFLFCCVLVASGIFAFDPSFSWYYRNIMLSWIIAYLLLINIVNSEARFFLFIFAYLLFSFKMSQHGAVSWSQRGFSFASHGLIGSPGWFRNSGEYAIQMLIYGSLAISFVVSLRNYWGRYKRWFFYAAAITGFMAVMGASSRGSQLGLAAIGCWILLKQKGGFKGLIAMVVAAGFLYMILPDEQLTRFQEMGEDESSLQRLTYWAIGIDIIKDHPLIGIGYLNWVRYLGYLYPGGVGVLDTIQESHNIYIQAASELGITGLICFLCMIFVSFSLNAKTRKIAKTIGNSFYSNISYGLDAGLIGYLVAGSFVTVLYYPFFWMQMAMIVSLNHVANIALKKHDKSDGSISVK